MYRVHAIGDSHVLHMGDQLFVHHFADKQMQGATAHNLINDKSATRSKEKLERLVKRLVPGEDTLLLSFGEIDCRLHLRTLKAVDKTVARYCQALWKLKAKGFRVVVHGVIGAVPQDNAWRQKDYPSQVARGGSVLYFNGRLKVWCENNGCEFITPPTHDSYGRLFDGFTDDGVHLNTLGAGFYNSLIPTLGGKVQNIVWCLDSMQTFGETASEALGWPLMVNSPVGECDNVFIVGMYDPPTYQHTLEATARAKHRIIQICGIDAKFAEPDFLPEATYFSSAECYRRTFFERTGIDAPELLLPCPNDPPVYPMPETPMVTSYLGRENKKYGGQFIEALMEALPDVRFYTYGLGSHDTAAMHNVMAQTTVQLQLGNGNGGCSLREAMQAGRTAIGTIDYPGVVMFHPDDFTGLIANVKKALERKEPDRELAKKWKRLNDPKVFVETVKGACK